MRQSVKGIAWFGWSAWYECVCVYIMSRVHSNKTCVRTMARRPFLTSLSWSFLRLCSSLAKPRGSNLKSPGCAFVGGWGVRAGLRDEPALCDARTNSGHKCSHSTRTAAYLAAGALEHLRDGDGADGLGDGRPDQDLGQRAGLDGHVVGGEGRHLVHVACFGGTQVVDMGGRRVSRLPRYGDTQACLRGQTCRLGTEGKRTYRGA